MTEEQKQKLEAQLWKIANELRGKMGADEFRDYILGFIFYKYLSEKQYLFANKLLETEKVKDYNLVKNKADLKAIKEESLEKLGYFLRPDELFSALTKKGNIKIDEDDEEAKDNFILEDLQTILNAIEQSTMGNESEDDFNKLFEDIDLASTKLGRSREKLDEYIADYNKMFGTNYSTKDNKLFYAYYKDIGKRVKNKEIDILLVVNMFLTGFDSKPLNTIYVDKNLKYHGLLQAYSRTNRTMGQKKSQGNVVCFRNLKPATDKAIELFANKEAQEDIILAPYEDYVRKFGQAVANLLAITPDVASVDSLLTEEDEAKFIQAFRELIRIKNVLDCFTQFTFDDLPMNEQLFVDFRSKYLDLYDKVRSEKEKERVSILDDIDFEIELISRDKINVSYIINLLRNMKDKKPEDQAKAHKAIMDILDTETQLRSKKELIEKFISQHFADMPARADVGDEFEAYWTEEKRKALEAMSKEEGLDPEGLDKVLGNYLFTEKPPMRDEIIEIMEKRPSLRERSTVAERVIGKIRDFVETFIDGVD